MSLNLVWTVLHMFEQADLLDTELVSLRYALCFWCFSPRSPWISLSFSSNQSCCLGDTGPRESIAEECSVSLKTVQLSSTPSELCSSASKWLQISLLNTCLLLSFQLGDIQSLGHFLALWLSYRLNIRYFIVYEGGLARSKAMVSYTNWSC